MKIVVTSDTHIKTIAKKPLPEKLREACKQADLIIHAGDWQTPEVYEELNQYAPVKGVWGNTDAEDIKQYVSDQAIVEAAGYRIGIVHGHGDTKTTEQRVKATFQDEEVSLDIVIFGHSHIAYMRYMGKTLFLNPGSPTDKRRSPYYSFAVLNLAEDIQCDFIYFS
ncbi:MAG TPA: metallophosphoesterase family protein [Candidatus Avamphibacillus intestinigallinarum]|nr:metallophosphoesterase family protein [Candidatus Avamphibacillus intestinigallinarum]